MIELCNSPAKVVKIPIPTKCFWENFEVSKNIFFQVIETKSLMALYMIMGICTPAELINISHVSKYVGGTPSFDTKQGNFLLMMVIELPSLSAQYIK